MKPMLAYILIAVLLLTFVGCGNEIIYPQVQTNSSHATIDKCDPEPVTFENLRRNYALIVCANVIDTATDIEILGRNTNRCDLAQIKVLDVLKGDAKAGDRLWVEDSFNRREQLDEHGNAVGTLESGWSGEPLMNKGNRVLLFLNPLEELTVDGDTCYVTAPYAKYYLDRDGLYHCSLLYSSFFLNYFYSADDTDGIGVVPTDLVPKTLDEFQALISE